MGDLFLGMDAVALAKLGKLVFDAAKGVSNYYRETKAAADGPRIAVYLWGSLLFEARRDADRVRWIVQQGQQGGLTWGQMSFTITDALMGEFSKLVPYPMVLDQLGHVDAGLRRVDFYQRAGGLATSTRLPNGQILPLPEAQAQFSRAIAFSVDFLEKKHPERFNRLLELADHFGKQAFDAEWMSLSSAVLPERMDMSGPVPGDRL